MNATSENVCFQTIQCGWKVWVETLFSKFNIYQLTANKNCPLLEFVLEEMFCQGSWLRSWSNKPVFTPRIPKCVLDMDELQRQTYSKVPITGIP